MEEEEAKKKWCPMVRFTLAPQNSILDVIGNRSAITPKYTTNCIASECMMWRWQSLPVSKPIDGYCGLAGKVNG